MTASATSTKDSLKGLTAAGTIVAGWCANLAWLLGLELPATSPWLVAAGALVQTFLHTGLFITAHDAMHGTVCPANRRVNDAVGTVAVRLYALFSYAALVDKHGAHHERPVTDEDPDFHDAPRERFWPWYAGFLTEYVGLLQIVGMAVAYNVLHHLFGVGLWNLNLLWVAPSLLSTLQLFYFGTYLPHRRPSDGHADEHRATTNDFPPWLSFLTCYHFGYHWEHHERPGVPWWRLPRVREDKKSRGAHSSPSDSHHKVG